MRLIVTILLFFVVLLGLDAQGALLYTGRVMDAASQRALERAVIEVDDSYQMLDASAQFQLFVEAGDTLIFRHLGYQPVAIVIEDTTLLSDLPKVVFLHLSSLTLGEVEVRPYVLTDEMKAHAAHLVERVVQQAQAADGLHYDFSNPERGVTGTGLSSSQMLGFNLITILNKMRASRKPRKKLQPRLKITSYEDYLRSQAQQEDRDTFISKSYVFSSSYSLKHFFDKF